MSRRRSRRRRKKTYNNNRFFWIIISLVAISVFLLGLLLVKLEELERNRIPHEITPKVSKQDKESMDEKIERYIHPEPFIYRGKVAIIIDDMGYDEKVFEEFVSLGIPLTFSILPGEPYSVNIAREAKRLNYEIMLHLPMESKNHRLNGKNMISENMTRDEMIYRLKQDIESVPYIVGVNNHMGSLLTENREIMNILLREIDRRGLFFLDSRTTATSVAFDVARSMGIRSGKRDVFLDNEPSIVYIEEQIDRLIDIAKKKGRATAIGHPKRETVEALREKIPLFRKEGLKLVFASEIMY